MRVLIGAGTKRPARTMRAVSGPETGGKPHAARRDVMQRVMLRRLRAEPSAPQHDQHDHVGNGQGKVHADHPRQHREAPLDTV
jgi:hypothetical protein